MTRGRSSVAHTPLPSPRCHGRPTPPPWASPSFPVSLRSLESRCHVQEGLVGPQEPASGSGWQQPWLQPRLRQHPRFLGRVRPPEEVASRAGVPARLAGTRGAPRAPGGSSRFPRVRPSLAPFVSAGHLLNEFSILGAETNRGRGAQEVSAGPATAAPGGGSERSSSFNLPQG